MEAGAEKEPFKKAERDTRGERWPAGTLTTCKRRIPTRIKVILPNLLRMASREGRARARPGCAKDFCPRTGKSRRQSDRHGYAKELIAQARAKGNAEYFVSPANKLTFAKDSGFDAALCASIAKYRRPCGRA